MSTNRWDKLPTPWKYDLLRDMGLNCKLAPMDWDQLPTDIRTQLEEILPEAIQMMEQEHEERISDVEVSIREENRYMAEAGRWERLAYDLEHGG